APATTTIGEPVYLPPITAPAEGAPQTISAMPPQGAIFAAPATQVPATTTIGEAVYLPPITAPAQGIPQTMGGMPPGAVFAAPAAQGPATIGQPVYLPPVTVAGGQAPGTAYPGTMVPGTMVPGTMVPGTMVPGTMVPGTMVPGTVAGAAATDIFSMMDTNNDGVVSRAEFAAAMQSGGIAPVGDVPTEPVQGQ
ncbi:unnamed protein product, partial [Symbiodinium sp. KB8]